MFENRMLKRIFGYKREEGMVEWRKLPNQELHNLYSSANIIWIRRVGVCSTHRGDDKWIQKIWCQKSWREETI